MVRELSLLFSLALVSTKASGQDLESIRRANLRGARSVSVILAVSNTLLLTQGAFSREGGTAAAELEFRKAGLEVVPYRADGTGVMFGVQIVCADAKLTCAMVADLTRVFEAPGVVRVVGEIWSSGPVALYDADWSSAARRIREWIAEQATIVANELRAANPRPPG